MAALAVISQDRQVIFPAHPRTRQRIAEFGLIPKTQSINLIEPLGYVDFLALESHADLVLTDSGGVQEEAPTLGKPILVMRENTERPEALSAGCARLVGTDRDTTVSEVKRLLTAASAYRSMSHGASPYRDGKTSERIARIVHDYVARSAG